MKWCMYISISIRWIHCCILFAGRDEVTCSVGNIACLSWRVVSTVRCFVYFIIAEDTLDSIDHRQLLSRQCRAKAFFRNTFSQHNMFLFLILCTVLITSCFGIRMALVDKVSIKPVIIGGGPAGLSTAIMLAKRGYTDIKVYERLPEYPRSNDVATWERLRSYVIGIKTLLSVVHRPQGGTSCFLPFYYYTTVPGSIFPILLSRVRYGRPSYRII